MKMPHFGLLLLLVFPFALIAQPGSLSSNNKKAIQFFQDGLRQFEYRRNDAAYELLSRATKEDDGFFEAHMLLGDVCTDLDKTDEAITHYKRALEIKSDKFPPVYYNLAGAEMDAGKYDDAIAHLETFLKLSNVRPELKKKGERRLENAKFAMYAFAHPVPFNPINLGKNVNSEYNDYHPSLTVDEGLLIYTRMRPSDEETDNGGAPVEEDFYITRKTNGEWVPSIPLGPPINTHRNEGAHCISPDGKFFFYTGCERPDGYGSCDIYVSELQGNKWSNPRNLGEPLNSGAWDAQPTLSPDGKTLIFTSKRSGGLGMADLWMSHKRENGTWTMPENLGEVINTDQDEFGPFLHPDGRTLYFSSSGHPGMGKKDVFYSKLKPDGTWDKPVNLGYPINTKEDEIHMVVSPDGKRGYFSSDREGGSGLRDIYGFELYESARPAQVTFLKGKVRDEQTLKPVKSVIEVIDVKTGELRASTTSDPITGEFLISLPAGAKYAVNAEAKGYLFYSGTYTLGKELSIKDEFAVDILLSPVIEGAKVVLNNVFFETGKSELMPESKVELNKLINFLQRNPLVRIEIGGHTDAVGNDASNQLLSEQRAQSVSKYLVSNQVDANRIESKGYGETSPIATNDTEEGKALNRRTEFKVIGAKK